MRQPNREALLHVGTGLLLAAAWGPYALWFSILVSAIRARAFLGYWPSYNRPDPGTLPETFGPLPAWSETAVPILGVAVLVVVSLLRLRRMVPRRWWLWTATVIWPLAWGAFLLLARVDPGGIMDWYFD